MSNPGSSIHAPAANISIDELDLALADLNLDDDDGSIVEAALEEIEEEPVSIEMNAMTERALEALNVKDEIYEDTATSSTMDDEAVVKTAKPAKAPKAPKEPKAASAKSTKPKIERDLSALPVDLFQFDCDNAATEQMKIDLLSQRPTQKKIGEKFDNVLQALNAGRAPSVYVMDCFKALDGAPGKTLASKDMIAILTTTDKRTDTKLGGATYAQGTASSQAGQMMVLFPALGIANRTGSSLTIRDSSKFAERLRAL